MWNEIRERKWIVLGLNGILKNKWIKNTEREKKKGTKLEKKIHHSAINKDERRLM